MGVRSPQPGSPLGLSRPNPVRVESVGHLRAHQTAQRNTAPFALHQVYQGGEVTGGRRVYVGNINYDTKEEDIKTEFSLVRLAHGRLWAHALSLRTLSLSP